MGNLKMNVILIYISNFTLYEQSKPGKARMEIKWGSNDEQSGIKTGLCRKKNSKW